MSAQQALRRANIVARLEAIIQQRRKRLVFLGRPVEAESSIRIFMPLYSAPDYKPPPLPRGPHWETILPNLSRRRIRPGYRRERLDLSDGDFVDLDFAQVSPARQSAAVLLLLHGLEGDSRAPYVASWVRAATRRGLDCVALNLRGCSGELNRLPRFYHSGETQDLVETVAYLERRYEAIALVGFSLGGNVALKRLGEGMPPLEKSLRAAVAISAPIDLAGSARRLGERSNAFYMRRFIRLLSRKIELKAQVYPGSLDPRGARSMRSFAEFDEAYTAPLSGFASAEDYWARCSARAWLPRIRVPALLIAARNDPFLSVGCYPATEAELGPLVQALYPARGGHIGFPGWRQQGEAWHERVGLDFLAQVLS